MFDDNNSFVYNSLWKKGLHLIGKLLNMSANLCSPMKLSKGDKKVVTIEDVISDCIVVSLIYQNKRFCGALMDISKR